MNYDGMVRAQHFFQPKSHGYDEEACLGSSVFCWFLGSLLFESLFLFFAEKECSACDTLGIAVFLRWWCFLMGVYSYRGCATLECFFTMLFDSVAVNIECMARKSVFDQISRIPITTVIDVVAVLLSPFSVVAFLF